MKLTLPHLPTQAAAIKKIDDHLNYLLRQRFPGVNIIDPEKNWDENIMRFSFTVEKLIFSLDFEGNAIVTDQEAILESELPNIVTNFVSEETIKNVIRKKFNELFNIK